MSAAWTTITVGARTQYAVKVSLVDLDWILQWRWTYARSHKYGQLIYARRSVRVGTANVTILMHREIIIQRMGIERPSSAHFVDHENGDALDNRRVNDHGKPQLSWLTMVENMAKQRGVRSWPLPARAESIPF